MNRKFKKKNPHNMPQFHMIKYHEIKLKPKNIYIYEKAREAFSSCHKIVTLCYKMHHLLRLWLLIIVFTTLLFQQNFFCFLNKWKLPFLNPNHKYCLCILVLFSSHHNLACISPNFSRLEIVRYKVSKHTQVINPWWDIRMLIMW